jgi:hypothetical protein
MERVNPSSKPAEPLGRPSADDSTVDHYEGIDLAPSIPESIATWDVSGHARREQDRLRRKQLHP